MILYIYLQENKILAKNTRTRFKFGQNLKISLYFAAI